MRHLILDVETNSKNPALADLKVFGAYDIELDKYFIIKYDNNSKYLQSIVDQYDWIITFNGVHYDMPVLERHNVTAAYWKIIDLYQVFKKRTTMIKADGFDSFSLRNLIEELELDEAGKGDIDYTVFMKSSWTKEEQDDIVKYLKQDLVLTLKLWIYLKDRFKDFGVFIPEKDAARYKHITMSAGAFAYKAICMKSGLPEIYNDVIDHIIFEGGFVSAPSQESAKGIIVVLDFTSLYPFMDIMGNLYTTIDKCAHKVNGVCPNQWAGNEFFTVKGRYCICEPGPVEKTIKEFFLIRKEYKKNKDSREQAVKIIINGSYGASGSETFASIFTPTTAPDCCLLGQQCVKYARKVLTEKGFIVLYSDTDSAYVTIPDGKTLDELRIVSKEITAYLASKFPFGWPEEFDFKVDDEIKFISWFPNDDGTYKKKMYLFVNSKDKLKVKGLKVIKLDCSGVSKKIFDEILRPRIVSELSCKYSEKYIKELIEKYLKEDLSLGLKRFNVKEEYNGDTSIQEQIRKLYGSGELKLIKNKKIGAGKSGKYCTLEEAQKLQFSDLDLDVYLKELKPFIIGRAQTGGLNGFI